MSEFMDTSKIVKELISYHSGVSIEKLSDETLIEEDLGTTGDDAWELMEDFQEKFKVDLDEFEFSLHFGPEAGFYVSKEYGYYPVSIKHLVNVAEEKQWKLPPRNEENYERFKRGRKITWTLFIIFIIFVILLYTWLITNDYPRSCVTLDILINMNISNISQA